MTATELPQTAQSDDRYKILQTLGELLEIDVPLTGTEALSSFEKWDSLTVISFIAYADEEFGKVLSGTAILEAKTVDDLVALVN